MDNSTFACPGHQHGAFLKASGGPAVLDFFGENVFRADMCNADVKLGDLLIHEGLPNTRRSSRRRSSTPIKPTSSSTAPRANKVVTNALLTRGDLVLFDRNNHKSNHHGALIQAGATPVYLEASRNPFGFIGGIDDRCFDENTCAI
jgi:ornithine decarboxylase